MCRYIVPTEQAGEDLSCFLRGLGFSRREISQMKYLSPGIRVDGERARVNHLLREGQSVELPLSAGSEEDRTGEKTGRQSNRALIYEDDAVLVLYKPAGMASHCCRGYEENHAGRLAFGEDASGGQVIRAVGRLDKDTCGLMLFAKTKIAAARLWQQHADGRCFKSYHAWIHGTLPQKQGRISLPVPDYTGGNRRLDPPPMTGAVTRYECLGETGIRGETVSHVRFFLETGRMHQIRLHMQAMGTPILGDVLYGFEDGAGQLHLEADRLCWSHPFRGEEHQAAVQKLCLQ